MNIWYQLLKENLFLSNGDHTYWMAPAGFWRHKIYAWENFSGLGNHNGAIPQFLFYLLFQLQTYLGINRSTLQLFLILIFSILAVYTFSIFYLEFKKIFNLKHKIKFNLDAVLASLVYVLNPYDVNFLQIEKLILTFLLPLILFFLLKAVRTSKNIYIILAAILTLIFSPMSINLAVFGSLFVFVFITFIVVGIIKKEFLYYFLTALYFSFLSFLFNSWWVFPTLHLLLFSSATAIKFLQGTNFLNSVDLQSAIRSISTWAWYSGHNNQPYYSYALRYDSGLYLILSYLFIIPSFVLLIFKSHTSKYRNFYYTILTIILVSLFISKGSTPPFGNIFTILFKYIPFFSIFREPSAKFILIYKLYFSFAFGLLLFEIFNIKKNTRYLIFTFIGLFALFGLWAYPVFSGEIIKQKWNEIIRTSVISMPTYWKEIYAYSKQEEIQEEVSSVLVYPATGYGAAYNWPNGFNGAEVAQYYVDKPILSYWNFEIDEKSIALNTLYPESINEPLPTNIYGLFNIGYVLHEKDADWRYSARKNYTPTRVENFLSQSPFQLKSDFGVFTKAYVKAIENRQDFNLVDEDLSSELLDKSALSLYQINEDNFVSKIYVPNQITRTDLDGIIETAYLNYPQKHYGFLSIDDPINKKFELKHNNTIYQSEKITSIKYSSTVWNDGWVWPVVNTYPDSYLYQLSQLKEKYTLFRAKNDLEKADIHLWLAAKRLTELKRENLNSNVKDDLYENYIENLTAARDILINLDFDSKTKNYYELVNKILLYINKSDEYVGVNIKNELPENLATLYENIVSELSYEISSICEDLCYKFIVEENSNYDIYAYKNQIEDLAFEYEEINLNTDDSKLVFNLSSLSENDKDFVKLGSLKLNQGINNVGANIESEENNILDNENWINFGNTYGESIPSDLELYVHTFPSKVIDDIKENSSEKLTEFTGKANYIKDWEQNSEYLISFDYEAKGAILGFIIAENVSEHEISSFNSYWDILTNSKSLLASNLFVKNNIDCVEENDGCVKHFEKIVKSSSIGNGAIVFVYSYTTEDWGGIRINNFEIKKRKALELFAVRNDSEENLNAGSAEVVNLSKIDPTRYVAQVNNTSNSHYLVFSETYNPGWKAYIINDSNNKILLPNHIRINGYANGWYLSKDFLDKNNIANEYKILIDYAPQSYIYWGWFVTIISVIASLLFINLKFRNRGNLNFALKFNLHPKFKVFFSNYWIEIAVLLILLPIIYAFKYNFGSLNNELTYTFVFFIFLILNFVDRLSVFYLKVLSIVFLICHFIFLFFNIVEVSKISISLFFITLIFYLWKLRKTLKQ